MSTIEAQNLNHLDQVFTNAIQWLQITSEHDRSIPKPDWSYPRNNDRVFRYLGERLAAGDYETAYILSTLEQQARQEKSTSWISDAEIQDTVRTNQFYMLARTMISFAQSAGDLER
ncbi:MAG TPA: hypothetical protein VLG13_03265 [Patescibacteria group bacterium]|nr:hypothetical protein [Patescibacteria group bacterium]